ncbi:hypothetical protein AGMMS50239_08900 [Bacteroidia bacterium]|nr:hypothetical protein AGMMS50239_08900 [Bacteroidia bacterium]
MNEKIGMQDLVVLLAEKANITKKDAETLIKECFEIMEEGLSEDKILKIRNLGTFKLVLVEDRESVDVSTGERVLIPAHYKVTFTPDIELAERINAPYASLETVEITENEIDDETDDENDDEFEGKFIEPDYLLTETEKQEEPESKEVESKHEEPVEIEHEEPVEIEHEEPVGIEHEEPVEIEHEEPEIEEVKEEQEKIETIYKEPEREEKEEEEKEEEEEEEEPVYPEQYDEDYQSVKARNSTFWFFFIIASAFILFFSGYYFCPMVTGGWRMAPDSIVVFSYSVNKSLVSDTLTVKTQEISSPETEPAIASKAQTAENQSSQTAENQSPQTFVNKKYKILKGERLNTIALREYGHKAFWVYIYDENRNEICKPDLIEPGMIINIPPAEKYGIDKNNRESVEKALKLEQQYKR